jgi:hypothetical protein
MLYKRVISEDQFDAIANVYAFGDSYDNHWDALTVVVCGNAVYYGVNF